jgi:uncharacterized protein YbaP (TraB family)
MKKIVLLSLSLLFSLYSFSQNSLLWKVENPDKPGRISYVFGTMHLQDSSINCFGDEVWSAITSCEVVAGELDLKDPKVMMSLMGKMNMKDTTLSDLLTPDEMKSLTKVMADLVEPFLWTMSQKMKPFFLMAPIYAAIDTLPKYDLPMDMRIMNAGKTSVGLETADEQMAAVESISLKDQAEMLFELTQNMDSVRSSFAEMKKLYLAQDIDGLLEFTELAEVDPSFSTNFIVTRNQRMAERLVSMLDTQTVFCAVGAAHLAGEEGMLNYLREKSFVLTPVKFSFMSEGCK